ncbi:MAG: hypothetical protein KZQ60_18925 [Candidatus Thiodiazotropha sp. (ex Lucinoma aequizonata)]|nr:hypothetical protein [Candidatus Thiodiazotropha sp. (ex Lucinoma aequizonata)]
MSKPSVLELKVKQTSLVSADLFQPVGNISSAVVSGERAASTGDLTQPSGKLLGILPYRALVTGELIHPKGSLLSAVVAGKRATSTGNLIQPSGKLSGVLSDTAMATGELIQPSMTLTGKMTTDNACTPFLMPDITIEYPTRYRPNVKPAGYLKVDKSHPLALDLVFHLSSSASLFTNTYTTKTLSEVINDGGRTFYFAPSKGGLTKNKQNIITNTDPGYSWFMIFKAMPPYSGTGRSGNMLMTKANKIDFRWDDSNSACKPIIRNSAGYDLAPSHLINSSKDLNAPPEWYTLSLSSFSTTSSAFYKDGLKVATVARGLDATDRNGFLKISTKNTASWVGHVLVCYEWHRALSDEEHASLALKPFQFLRQV